MANKQEEGWGLGLVEPGDLMPVRGTDKAQKGRESRDSARLGRRGKKQALGTFQTDGDLEQPRAC